MNRIIAALVLFAVAAFGASKLRDGYRDGQMPVLLFGRVNPLVFGRAANPALFWIATVISLVVVAAMALGAILILAAGSGR